MAYNSRLERFLGLQWTTERPYEGGSRRSPTFSVSQDEYHLEMKLGLVVRKRSTCYIELHWHKPRVQRLSVGCYLMARGKSFCGAKYLINTNPCMEYILVKDIDEADTIPSGGMEEWTVFMFYSRYSLSLQVENQTIECVVKKKKVDESIQVSSEVPRDTETLSSDFSGMLEEEILPDFRLECGGRVFPVHRSVLSARSEVFRAMFRSGMLESQTGSADIKNLEVPVLESLLKFIYSGRLGDLTEDTAGSLYEAADKYAVSSLRKACSYWMKRNLAEDNCVRYLSVAESHSDLDLGAGIVSFIFQHPGILKSPAWLAFSQQHPLSANAVLQAYISSAVP